MKLKLVILTMLFLYIATICGCFAANVNTAKSENENLNPEINIIEEKLNSMSISEKIGQMIVIGIHGNEINDDSKFMLTQYHVGGIIFFDRNMENKTQVKRFIEDLQSNANEKVPLFIAVDQEGGRVSRMKHELTPPPSQAAIGAGGNFFDALTYARFSGQELKALGFNVNFAPVADVGNDDRQFSSDPYIVSEFVSNAAKGYEDAGIFYCLKHFPGIGRGTVDSHKDISIIDGDKKFLKNHDMLPFIKIIEEQDNSKFMIMISHFKYTALDLDNPASLSPVVMSDILRNELHFEGVIITDDLEMGATSNYNDFSEMGVQAIKSGADIVLVCHEYEHEIKVYTGILQAVEQGIISEERINESVRRILKMKLQL